MVRRPVVLSTMMTAVRLHLAGESEKRDNRA
jgi:hypothetical protein